MPETTSLDELQRRLAERLRYTTPEAQTTTIVVCPSLSFPVAELRKIAGIEFYEERLLFFALLLDDNPDLEVVYPTSMPIDDAVIAYYLSWLADPAGARDRLHLHQVGDPTPGALTDKLLGRPDLLAALRARVRDPDNAIILPFNVTPSEGRLAETLGIPLYAPHPDLVWLGSKSGARAVAREAGVRVFDGTSDLYSIDELERAVGDLRTRRPDAQAAVAKLNNGFSGQGNVIIELAGLRSPLTTSPAIFCAAEETWESYASKIAVEGAVVEELARGPNLPSPSVQVRILPGERCEVLSTHDQILGGPDEQVYLGCRFPARADYRARICDDALRVAHVLARRGVLGSFGIDFVVVPDRGVFLSEINLRLGGTTHPFLMARHVTGGEYVAETGELVVDGRARVYKGSDNIRSTRYVGMRPAEAIDAVADAGLAYDPATASGATLHLLGALPTHGKYGLVCIADSHEHADALYERVVACIDAVADWR